MNNTPLPEDLVPKSFIDQFGSLIKCALGGWDRLRFHASLRPLFSPQWMRTYLCAAKVRLVDFAQHAQSLTQRLLQEAQNRAAAAQRPYHFLRSSKISKEKFIEDIAQRDHIHSGLIAVLGALEPCLALTVRGARDRRWLQPVLEQRKCLHLYHYYEHPLVGRCHVRLQSWYPFSVDVCLNGRLWLAKQMDAAGLAYRRADNCFVELADPVAAQQLADAQHQTNWLELLNGLLAPAHPLREQILKPFPNLFYYWSVTQSEYATDLLFTNQDDLARAYRAFVLHGLCTFQSPDVTDLPRRAEVSRAANKRYLDALASTQVGTPLGEMVGPLCRPLTHDGRHFRALQPLGTDAPLLGALSRGEWTIAGFRNRDIQHLLYGSPPRDNKVARRRSAAVGRKLRLLRAHGLIRKLPHTHRYQITDSGRTMITALVAAQQANTQKLTLALAA